VREKAKKKILFSVILFIILLSGLFFSGGPLLYPDSYEYLDGNTYLPALYPVLLKWMQMIFGELYLYGIVTFQTILAVISIVWLGAVLIQTFEITSFWMKFLVYGSLVGTFFVDNLNLLKGIETSNLWVLTEGITYPLFFMFVAGSIQLFLRKKTADVILCLVLVSLLTLGRQQMWACFAMIIIYFAYFLIFTQIEKKKVVQWIFMLVGFALLTTGLQTIYKHSGNAEHPFYKQNTVSHLFFFAEEADGRYLENADEQELFQTIYRNLREERLHYDDAGESWLEKQNAYIYNFNSITGLYEEILFDYARQQGLTDDEVLVKAYQIMGHFEEALGYHTSEWLLMTVSQFPITLSVTVFTYKESFAWLAIIYASLVTLIYLGMLFCILWKKRKFTKETLFAAMLFIYITGSGLATTFLIRSLGRYMFYSCGLFYLVGFLMLRALYKERVSKKAEKQVE